MKYRRSLQRGTEEVGFEPTKACTLHDFQSCSLDHYETPPDVPQMPQHGHGGESGIRTHEGLHPTAFRERHFRPLRHLSVPEYSISFVIWQAVSLTNFSTSSFLQVLDIATLVESGAYELRPYAPTGAWTPRARGRVGAQFIAPDHPSHTLALR